MTTPAKWTGAKGAPTRLYLLRHGQTEMSVDRRYSGSRDVPLTETGRAQAAAAAKRLGEVPELTGAPVLSSPLSRAKATAGLSAEALGVEVTEHEGLRETDFGHWEGLTFAEAAAQDPEVHAAWLRDFSVAPPGGESFDAAHARVETTLDDVLSRYPGQPLVLVSHVTPIKCLLRIGLDSGPRLLFRLHLDLASLSVVEFYPDGNASVRLVNDTSHLDS